MMKKTALYKTTEFPIDSKRYVKYRLPAGIGDRNRMDVDIQTDRLFQQTKNARQKKTGDGTCENKKER